MKMTTAEVRLDYMNKDLSFDFGDLELKPGDVVVVETDYGMDMGMITEFHENREVDEKQPPFKKILRIANDEDLNRQAALGPKEEEAFRVCEEEIAKAKLGMKLVNARFSFDGSRVTFCYTAESRVDFRELVKTLASRLQTRIELRQVGVRDEARLFGGFGPCGRRLCCAAFLRDFKSVSIKMAKEQGLPLNPMKISGVCGRLFCCLKYEYDEYVQLRRFMPDFGQMIEKDDVKGRITAVNVMKRTVTVATEGGGWAEVDIDIPEEKLKCTCGPCACEFHDSADEGDDLPPPDEDAPQQKPRSCRRGGGRDRNRNHGGENK